MQEKFLGLGRGQRREKLWKQKYITKNLLSVLTLAAQILTLERHKDEGGSCANSWHTNSWHSPYFAFTSWERKALISIISYPIEGPSHFKPYSNFSSRKGGESLLTVFSHHSMFICFALLKTSKNCFLVPPEGMWFGHVQTPWIHFSPF